MALDRETVFLILDERFQDLYPEDVRFVYKVKNALHGHRGNPKFSKGKLAQEL